MIANDFIAIYNDVIFCRKACYVGGFIFPETGIYLIGDSGDNDFYAFSITGDIEHTKTTIKTIDEKFLPIGKPLFVNIKTTGGNSVTGTANMSYSEFRYLIESNVYLGAYANFADIISPVVVMADRLDCLVLSFSDNTDNPIMTVYWLQDDTVTLNDPME